MIRRLLIYVICILIVCSCFAGSVMATEDEQKSVMISSGSYTVDAAKPYLGTDGLVENVKSVFMFETKSQTLLYEWFAD